MAFPRDVVRRGCRSYYATRMGRVLIRVARIVTIAVIMLAVRPAGAVPSFARQTGFDCTVCHTIYPELTPVGRRFKLYGYTWTNKAPEATVVAGRDPTAPPPSTTEQIGRASCRERV